MTDGCVKSSHNSVTFGSKDKDWVIQIRNLICPEMKIRKDGNYYSFGIYSKELKLWLISKGCTPKKSLTLKFPQVPEKYLADFIRGCIDGDGSLGNYSNENRISIKCYLCGSSFDFINSFSNILHEKQIKNYISKSAKKDNRSDHWRVDLQNKHAQKFLAWIYYPSHQLSMTRKNIIAQNAILFKIAKRGRKPNLEKQSKAKLMRLNGLSTKQIALELQTSISRVNDWLRI